jgi:hypothetical protein
MKISALHDPFCSFDSLGSGLEVCFFRVLKRPLNCDFWIRPMQPLDSAYLPEWIPDPSPCFFSCFETNLFLPVQTLPSFGLSPLYATFDSEQNV